MKKQMLIIMSVAVFAVILSPSAFSESNSKAYGGYTLFSPLFGTTTYFINMDGQVVHTWETGSSAAFTTYFLENGNLLRSSSTGGGMGLGGMGFGIGMGQRRGGQGAAQGQTEPQRPSGIGAGGKLQEIDWDGNSVWEYEYATDTVVPHHDMKKIPNGNLLLICWDRKTADESIAAGRNPEYQNGSLNPDCIIELKRTGDNQWEVIWQWYVWDHLIQDFDESKSNYGNVTEHPERIDINYSESWADAPAGGGRQGNRGGMGGGMMGGMGMGGGGRIATEDWTHFNAIDYNEELDLIAVSSYTFSEFWIIDHSTTTQEAAGHAGGKFGKGGDILYRWGNPAAYKQGTNADQTLFCPHDIQWIAKGLPGEGNMLIFNNGPNRQDGRYSTVEEFILPLDNGTFKIDGKKFAAVEPVWHYMDPDDKTNFYATNISGAQRLPNGNTLICEGPRGHLFEVTADKQIVWDYRFTAQAGARGGARGGRMGGMGGMMGGGFPSQIFRAYRIPLDHPALKGKDLTVKNSDSPVQEN